MSETLPHHVKAIFGRSRAVLIVAGVAIMIYLLVPILVVFPAAFTDSPMIQVPPDGFTWRWFGRFFSDPGWVRAFGTSLQVAAVSATLATIVATLAVLALARGPRTAVWLRPLFFLPMVFPVVVLALGLLRAGTTLGVNGTLWPLVVGQTLICLPPAFIAVSAGLVRVDPALSKAANSMGASWWTTMFRVELPLMRGSVVTAFFLAFVYGFDEVVLAIFLAPAAQTTLPAKLYAAASLSLEPTLASASVIVVGLVLTGVGLYYLSSKLISRSRPA